MSHATDSGNRSIPESGHLNDLKLAASKMLGEKRRAFQAEMTVKYCAGSPRQAEKLFDRISRYPNYKIYVAVADNEIVGSFALLVMDNLAHMGAPSAIVEDVVVTPHRQGQGIGTHMMQFAMDQCKKHGCYKLVLSSNKKRAEAHKFYQKLGFELHGYSFVVKL